jgi:hypothetical protein
VILSTGQKYQFFGLQLTSQSDKPVSQASQSLVKYYGELKIRVFEMKYTCVQNAVVEDVGNRTSGLIKSGDTFEPVCMDEVAKILAAFVVCLQGRN